jgi:hypothetical protein
MSSHRDPELPAAHERYLATLGMDALAASMHTRR